MHCCYITLFCPKARVEEVGGFEKICILSFRACLSKNFIFAMLYCIHLTSCKCSIFVTDVCSSINFFKQNIGAI